ncbi:MAG: outer membrane protein assembly factor BamB [Aquisalimonadaceae bacterium]
MMRWLQTVVLALVLAGCSSTPVRESPVDSLADSQSGLDVSTLWSSRAGRGQNAQGDALVPAVHGENVYVVDHRGRLGAWRLSDGRQQWRMELDRPVSGGPAVTDGLIVVGTSDGMVVGIDPEDSEVIWESGVTSEVLSVPAISDQAVLVMSGDGRLFALRQDNGSRRWIYDRTIPSLLLRGTSSPVLLNDLVLAGLASGRLAAVRLRDGALAWEMDVGVASGRSDLERMRDVDGDPVVVGSNVYVVGFQGRVLSADMDRGRTNWSRDLSSFSGLAVDDERVYVTESNGRIWALDRRTGASVWRQDSLEGIHGSAPVVTNDVVVIGDDRGRLTFLNATDGEVLARIEYESGGGISRAPVVVDGDLLVLTDQGRLLRLSLSRP